MQRMFLALTAALWTVGGFELVGLPGSVIEVTGCCENAAGQLTNALAKLLPTVASSPSQESCRGKWE